MNPTLTSYIWEQVLAERLCGARMDRVAVGQSLSDQDRRDIQSLAADEHNHAQWLRDCLPTAERDRYPGTWGASIREHIEQMRTLTPDEMIVTVYVPERYAVRTLARQAEIFEDAALPTVASCYRQILGEERRHVEVNGRVLRHLMGHRVVGDRVRRFYHAMVTGRYRQYHYDFLRQRAPA